MTVSRLAFLLTAATSVAACGGAALERAAPATAAAEPAGTAFVVRDTTIDATVTATGVAEAVARATVSTRLMGTVIEVVAREGDRVRAGDALVRIDARDLDARRSQVQAALAGAEAMQHEAQLMAGRMRVLYADSAAARVQLDAAEAALARANAGVAAAHAGEAELAAIADYSVVRAPFGGVITQRFVDPGAFAAPGAPLMSIQDDTRLRLVVTIAPSASKGVRRGMSVAASVEGIAVTAIVEGVVPTAMGSLYTINAIADNRAGSLLAGGSATIAIGDGTRQALLVPAQAVRREGDLTGIALKHGATTRWVKLGKPVGTSIEVLSGLTAGDTIIVPALLARGK